MERKFIDIIDEVKRRSGEARKHGRRCCANQLLLAATFLENELSSVKIQKETKE